MQTTTTHLGPLKTAIKSAIGAAGIAAVGIFAAASASASPIVQGLGTSETLVDGPMVTAYTVSNLAPSNAAIPGYTPKGQLWQADVTAQASSGIVTPVVSNFNARTGDNQTYRVISTAPAPEALSPAPINQGGQSTGKIYFDVTGVAPTGVVYNDGVADQLVWTTNAPPSGMTPAPAPGMTPSSPAPGMPNTVH